MLVAERSRISRLASFDCVVAVEIDPECVATLRLNRDWNVLDRSIHEVSSRDLMREARIERRQADVLIGGPRVEPFSKAGYWASGDARRLDDPRADTVSAFLRVLRDTLPRAFLMENVAGLAYKGKDEALQLIQTTLESINTSAGTDYRATLLVINAAEFGVPQARERAFRRIPRRGDYRHPSADPWCCGHRRSGDLI